MQRPFQQNTNNNLTHHHVAVSASTNSELLHWLESGRISKTRPYMLTAGMQTAGRGQHKRTWQSPIGNIYLSLYHPLAAPLSGLLSLVVGYHLTRLPIIQNLNRIRHQVGLPMIGVKWANDIGFYKRDAKNNLPKQEKNLESDNQDKEDSLVFNKLAGILIEPVTTGKRITGVVVGVGINIKAAPLLSERTKEGMDYHAVSLNQLITDTHTAVQSQDNKQITTLSALANSPRAEDLYLPVSATILRAIQQFIYFADSPYAVNKFISEYNMVSVLAGRDIQVLQHGSDNKSDKLDADTNAPTVALQQNVQQGKVLGINADGSLKLAQGSIENAQQALNIYTGNIRVTAIR